MCRRSALCRLCKASLLTDALRQRDALIQQGILAANMTGGAAVGREGGAGAAEICAIARLGKPCILSPPAPPLLAGFCILLHSVCMPGRQAV